MADIKKHRDRVSQGNSITVTDFVSLQVLPVILTIPTVGESVTFARVLADLHED
jgi:hypothetical protein